MRLAIGVSELVRLTLERFEYGSVPLLAVVAGKQKAKNKIGGHLFD